MRQRLQELHAACLPFVTRALRGRARRRLMLGSVLLVIAVVLMGAFIGRSASDDAHDVRVSLGLERSVWERGTREFTIFVDDERERREVLSDRDRGGGFGVIHHRSEEGWLLLDAVSEPHVVPPREYQGLQEQARALRNARLDLAPPDLDERRRSSHFDWYAPHDRQRLQAVIDAQLQPRVVVYESPLDAAATVRLVGALAGGLLLMLWMVIGPLWVGVQLAQELHENTLQPLTGTALTARQLVLGLAAGSLAPVAIVAGPLLLLVLGAALGAGRMIPALGMTLIGLAMGAMLVGLAMLVALGLGRQRAPGIVGIGLLGLLGAAALAGMALGIELDRYSLTAVTVVPGMGPWHLLCEAFVPQAHLSAGDAQALDVRLLLTTAGALALAFTIGRALERCVAGTHRTGALRPVEAFVAALVLSVLAVAAIPSRAEFGDTVLGAMALALVPMQLVLMGRAPGGDVPAALRRVPLGSLLREHAGWLGVLLVVAVAAAAEPIDPHPGAPVGVAHLLWAVLVAAMVTLRGATLPTTIAAKVWLLVCLGFVLVEYVTGVVWLLEEPELEMLFPLGAAHPVLGLVQVGMFVWIPISLVRGLVPDDGPAVAGRVRDGADAR